MKKLFLMLAVSSLSMSAMAQDDPTEKYSVSTNSFWSNWFIQTNVNWSAFYLGNDNILSNPFYKFPMGTAVGDNDHNVLTSLGFSVAVGKWFTPGLGLRTKANGLWLGKAFDSDVDKYLTLNEQVLFNLHNLIGGYDESRVWNCIPYFGGGIGIGLDSKDNTYVWSAGILNTFKISRKVALNLELGYMSYGQEMFRLPAVGGIHFDKRANAFSVEVGATFNLGKGTWNKTPDVDAIMAANQSQLDALNAALANAQAENARLKELLAQKPKETIVTKEVTKLATTPVSVFFNINRTKIASKKDLVNVEQLANYAKENNCNVVVTGYADSATGSVERNQKLSEGRAEAVKNALIDMGVDASKITTVAQGGVDTLSPISYNRRATVEIK